jgi:hypothetical protein
MPPANFDGDHAADAVAADEEAAYTGIIRGGKHICSELLDRAAAGRRPALAVTAQFDDENR